MYSPRKKYLSNRVKNLVRRGHLPQFLSKSVGKPQKKKILPKSWFLDFSWETTKKIQKHLNSTTKIFWFESKKEFACGIVYLQRIFMQNLCWKHSEKDLPKVVWKKKRDSEIQPELSCLLRNLNVVRLRDFDHVRQILRNFSCWVNCAYWRSIRVSRGDPISLLCKDRKTVQATLWNSFLP